MSGKSEYDRGVNTFSPAGRIFQIEYALAATNLGSTSVGIQTAEGVLIAAEKKVPSTLVDASSLNKISEIDSHIGCVMSGLVTDARILIETARVEASNHQFTYGEPMRVEACTLAVADSCLRFGERKGASISRPFGVALLIAGVDDQGPSLWLTDPSGSYVRYEAKAIGDGMEAQATLQEKYHKSMSLDEAEILAVSILKQVMEEKIKSDNVEVASVRTDTRKLEVYTADKVNKIIESLPA
ncbi:Proteasome subunit alpha type-5 [Diplonema papillatum]|nr:Proteasome subunit alpha type-5 [Diplonema papillatum]